MKKVFIDPGHGGDDPGAIAVNGGKEKLSNLIIARKLRDYLKDFVEIKMSRDGEENPSLYERTEEANNWGADIFVSLHADSSPFHPDVMGYHVIKTIRNDVKPAILANLIIDNLKKSTGRLPKSPAVWSRKSYKGNYDYYGVIRGAFMPSVIIERGFLSNPTEAKLLFDDDYLTKQAEGIANAILDYFGIKKEEEKMGTKDDIKGHWAEKEIREMIEKGILKGYDDGSFRPDGYLTRAELAVVIDRLLKLSK